MMNRGMTLLEITFATAILAVVVGILVSMNIGIGSTAQYQHAMAQRNDDAFTALQQMVVLLRNADWATTTVPEDGSSITFQLPEDLDGNGLPVDQDIRIELGTPITIQRDMNDLNGDGVTGRQLILIANNGADVRVLASSLNPDSEVENEDGTIQDTNANGFLDRGIFFERDEDLAGIRISIQTVGEILRYKREDSSRLIRINHEEIVRPRN